LAWGLFGADASYSSGTAAGARFGEFVRHMGKRTLQLRGQGMRNRDDRKRNAGSDESIFDRRCAGLVFEKSLHEAVHGLLPGHAFGP
jgi:hypothetical protein